MEFNISSEVQNILDSKKLDRSQFKDRAITTSALREETNSTGPQLRSQPVLQHDSRRRMKRG